jgi:regulator of ribonuclease activity A
MSFTADLCDKHAEQLQIVEGHFRSYGKKPYFMGHIETISTFEDNSRVRECVDRPGKGKVLVVDGGGSMRRALLGDNLAANAVKNGWEGIVIHGCIRDSDEIDRMQIGVRALGTHPMKTEKRGLGEHNVPLRFGGVDFIPGHWLCADEDGMVVSPVELDVTPF